MRISGLPGHPYWGTLRQSQIYRSKPSSKRNTPVEEKPTHDCDPQHIVPESQTGQRSHETAHERHKRRAREKRYGLVDPAAWDAINRSLMQQQRLSSWIVPNDLDGTRRSKLEAHPRKPDIPSRTSSERKALNRFIRDLEKYAQAAGSTGKVPITTPTPSESKASYHTVKPLLPYRDELAAAGLAVTSTDQKHRLSTERDAPVLRRTHDIHRGTDTSRGQTVELDGYFDFKQEKKNRSDLPRTRSGSIIRSTPPDGPDEAKTHPMEPSPAPPIPNPRPKLKPKSCDKRKLFPWLKRKPPMEKNNFEREPQDRFPPINDGPIQIYPEFPSPSLDLKEQIDARSQTSIQIRSMQHRRNKRLPQSPPLPRDIISPKKPPCTALSLAECEQQDQGPHPEPLVSKCKGADGDRQLHLLNHSRGQRGLIKGQAHLPQSETNIETIEEERDTSPSHYDRPTIDHYSSRTRRKTKLAPVNKAHQPSTVSSSQTHASSVRSLPFTAKYAITTSSSLERALDAVSRKFDKMDQQEDDPDGYPAGLVEKTNKPTKTASQQDVDHNPATRASESHSSCETNKVTKSNLTMPPERIAQSYFKPLPPEPPCAVPIAPQTQATNAPSDEKTNSEQTRTGQMLKDLNIFPDYDDGDINDRDVIKGLQVAVHAAADDMYDAYIRTRTGLRIRRFLADLKSVDEVP
ncbi:hypothetical protein F4810DRAFT_598430 [Camillea tinctor]|nr:hypothetical protein F4810DRAFT_598430 [Camillea tinctor]